MSEAGVTQSIGYCGALCCWHWHTVMPSLYCTRSRTSSQCKSTCSRRDRPRSNLRKSVCCLLGTVVQPSGWRDGVLDGRGRGAVELGGSWQGHHQRQQSTQETSGKVKVKVNVKWIFIAPSRETSKALRHGSHSVTCNYTDACLYLVSVHQVAPPQIEVANN